MDEDRKSCAVFATNDVVPTTPESRVFLNLNIGIIKHIGSGTVLHHGQGRKFADLELMNAFIRWKRPVAPRPIKVWRKLSHVSKNSV